MSLFIREFTDNHFDESGASALSEALIVNTTLTKVAFE